MKHILWISTLLAALPLALTTAFGAREIHVSPTGADNQPGTAAAPLKSPAAARDLARKFVGKQPVTIIFADGVYYLDQPLVLGPADSGTAKAPVVYMAANEGKAVLSGGMLLKLAWQPDQNGVFKAKTPTGLHLDQLFVNGGRQHMARYPDYDPGKTTHPYRGCAADAFAPGRAAKWADPAGGYIHAMHLRDWGGYHYLITGKNDKGEVTYEGGWQNNRPMGMSPNKRMVENIREELDAPGEWFHDRKADTIYFMPPAGMDLASATIEGVRLPNLVSFQGTKNKPVRFISFDGFVFRHTARTFMENKEPLLRSDWTIHRGGAAYFEGAEDCSILNTIIDQPGGNGVFASNYNHRLRFAGMHVFGCGASAFAFVGDPKAVRNPVFGYDAPHNLTKIDRTPGPLTENHPMECTVEDSLIHDVGTVEKQGAGVQISMSRRITVRHCSVYDTSRAGININEGTWGGHLIEGCDVFNTVQETGDHGSFNSWGRDRFWLPDVIAFANEVIKDPQLPFLDAIEKTIIRNSRWRCDHGWDIDLDDGSSNYEITNNLLLKGGLKLREGYRRIVTNNIIVNNSLHAHLWPPYSEDVFKNNIVMGGYRAIRMGIPKWGAEVNMNAFTTNHRERTAWNRHGADVQSVVADPMFKSPETGDYSVAENSPVLKIGFRNFPMDRFGVQKPSLKALAKTPALPAVNIKPDLSPYQPPDAKPVVWMGATLGEPRAEALSAYGVGFDSGGVSIEALDAASPLGKANGLAQGDLIQSFNGRTVKNIADLREAVARAGAGTPCFTVIRNQKPVIVNPAETNLQAVP